MPRFRCGGRGAGAPSLRASAVERWALRQLGSLDHEHRVARIAAKLFELTRPLHGLTRRHRATLRLAAVVHDVGRSIDDETHPQQGARLLRHARLPLSAADRRALMFLTRYHRGRIPRPGEEKILRPQDDVESLRILLACLRAADSLDSRVLESPRLAFAVRGRTLRITCALERLTDKSLKVYGRRKKFRLLEELLDCRVEVNVIQSRSLRIAA